MIPSVSNPYNSMRNPIDMLIPNEKKKTFLPMSACWTSYIAEEMEPSENVELTGHEQLEEIQRFRDKVTSGKLERRTIMLAADSKPDLVLGNTRVRCPFCYSTRTKILPALCQQIVFDAEEEARLQQCDGFINATAMQCEGTPEHQFMLCVGQMKNQVYMWTTGLPANGQLVREPSTHHDFR